MECNGNKEENDQSLQPSALRKNHGNANRAEEKTKLIAPPGLQEKISQFQSLYKTAKGKPILIVGPTGAGKSLFLQIFEKLWREKTGIEERLSPVNCSHFDPQMARSEIFGHVRGAYTDAGRDKVGWIETVARRNLPLILDEIGELKRDVQAKLLTVIEDGRFFRMGSTDVQEAHVQMIGATGNARRLRPDFRQRFLTFQIPPLYKRRGDILYYLYDQFPDLVKSLRRWEVLVLLSFNWPGNIRELERVARLLQIDSDSNKYAPNDNYKTESSNDELAINKIGIPLRFFGEEISEIGLEAGAIKSLYDGLKKQGVDLMRLEKLLNRYRFGIDHRSNELAFPELSKGPKFSYWLEWEERFGIKAYKPFEPFWEAELGYLLFGNLFFQNTNSDKNVLKLEKKNSIMQYTPASGNFSSDQVKKTIVPIFEYLSGIQLERGEIFPDQDADREKFFRNIALRYPSNEFLATITGGQAQGPAGGPDIFSMTYDDLQKYYHGGVLSRCGGNQKRAADKIGENYNTFRSRLRKLGLN